MKPKLHIQLDLFWEEENNPTYLSTIQNHFDTIILDKNNYIDIPVPPINFRGSLNFAKRFKFNYNFADCKSWIPVFRKYILSPGHTVFNDLGYYAYYYSEYDYPLYLRPADPYKSFAGQVFLTKEKFIQEYNYLTKNLNFSDDLMCVSAPIRKIDREWRTVFINQTFVDGCLYMKGNDFVEVEPGCPSGVQQLASKIAESDYFINEPNFVIDICESGGKLFLLEINSFESSSFYGTDLDKIYLTWAKTLT